MDDTIVKPLEKWHRNIRTKVALQEPLTNEEAQWLLEEYEDLHDEIESLDSESMQDLREWKEEAIKGLQLIGNTISIESSTKTTIVNLCRSILSSLEIE